MSHRTFCLLLVVLLLALSAGAAAIGRGNRFDEEGAAQDAFVAAQPKERLQSPTGNWRTVAEFGAQYSEEYGQWSYREDMLLDMPDSAPVYAPLSAAVARIEAMPTGGSRVLLRCAQERDVRNTIEISLHPVYGLRVFEGSRVGAGDVIGEGRGGVCLKAWRAGEAVDPLSLAEE